MNVPAPRYGEPVHLHSRSLYFTSWKYVRQGRFNWHKQDQSVETTGRTGEDMDPLFGDDTHLPVSWTGATDFRLAPDEPLILHLHMRQAKLYAIHFTE